ncbi:MAG: GNAT family N-acetyltransferase [Clostridia bacterium]|nr:GNAT family N-acetyltransferase [Clostridia bacterium]
MMRVGLPTGVRFVAAEADDARLISCLRQRVWSETYRGIYPDSAIDDFDYKTHEARDIARIEDPAFRVYVIYDGAAPVGYLYFADRGRVHVQSLYLIKTCRRRGIGSAAFEMIRRYCRGKGYRTFTCNCNAHNSPALAFYAKMGGRETGRDVGHENMQEDQIGLEFDV